MNHTTTTSGRRTQAERSAETRTRLLDATIRVIAEEGYAAATTRRICDVAGVSQGAQTHHFPYRVDLLAAAMEHLASQRISRYLDADLDLPDDLGRRFRALLDLLWEDFSSDLFTVWVRMWVAAAEDHELAARLPSVERRMRERMRDTAQRMIGSTITPEELAGAAQRLGLGTGDIEAMISTVLDSLAGLALRVHFEPRDRPLRDPWPRQRAVLERLFLT